MRPSDERYNRRGKQMTIQTYTVEARSADILQQVSNEVQETLLHHAPDQWTDEELDEIEQQVLNHIQGLLDQHEPLWTLQEFIARAARETKRLIYQRTKGIDADKLLNVLLDVGDKDHALLQWAFHTLDQDKITASLAKAKKIAAAELEQEDAAQLLTGAFVRTMLRGVRWARLEQVQRQDEIKKVSHKRFVPISDPQPTQA